jgi:hypothetical protein
MDSMIFNQINLIKDGQLQEQEPIKIPIMETLTMPKKKEKVNKYQNVNKSFGTLEEIAMTNILPYDSRFTGIPE